MPCARIGLVCCAALLLGAAASHAASITIFVPKHYYAPGELIEISITGDSMGAATTQVFARLLWSGDSAFVSSSQQAVTSFGGALPWLTGVLTNGPGFADVFNQLVGLTPLQLDGLFHASVRLSQGSPGTVQYSLNMNPGPTQLDFFESPEVNVVFGPEPTSGALLALGLGGLALSARRAAARKARISAGG